jgi:serine O-acetyltransferase
VIAAVLPFAKPPNYDRRGLPGPGGFFMATDIRLKETLPEITEALLATYTECSRINHLGHKPLPSREAIVEILADLMDILYPGYVRRQNLHMGNVEYHVGDLIDGLHDKLTQQIARVLRHEHCQETPAADFEKPAQQKAIELLRRLPDLRGQLELDVEAAYEGDPAAKGYHEIIFCYPGLEAISVYRIAHELLLLGVPLIPRMMTEFAHSKTGIDIHPGARIGPSFFIDHGTGVVIGETCDIGAHVKLYQGVTLGALSFPRDAAGNIIRGMKRHPTLEDDVVVYANATILGGDTVIGHHAVIGSNVWLTQSVEPNMVVSLEKPSLRIRGPETQDLVPRYQI